MSRQFKNGTCSCWKQVDKLLDKEGTALVKTLTFHGHQYMELLTERIDQRRTQPKRIVASFCPFCGKKLNEPKR